MTCYDCAVAGQSTPAVAVCVGCGAGVCRAHVVVGVRSLTRTAVINRVEVLEPPARVIQCAVCARATEAQARPATHRAGR